VIDDVRELKTVDSTTKGLMLVSKSTGTQDWRFRYMADGRDRVVTLGQFPAMSLAQARQAAETARNSVKQHGDAKGLHAANQPFSAFITQFYDKWAKSKRQGSIDVYAPVTKIVTAKLGLMPPAVITTRTIRQELKGLPASTAKRALYVIRESLRLAVLDGAVESNIARELTPDDMHAQDRVSVPRTALKLDDVKLTIESVEDRSPVSADVLWIVALCATRIEETVSMEWSHIDWEQKLWNVPARNRKGKLEKRNPLIVPLSDAAFAKLQEISNNRKVSDRWVFTGKKEQHVTRQSVFANLKLVDSDATVHGFRSLFKTEAAEADFPAYVTEAALGHSIRGLEGVYNKATYLEQRRELMQWWSAKLACRF
jgi:integrase